MHSEVLKRVAEEYVAGRRLRSQHDDLNGRPGREHRVASTSGKDELENEGFTRSISLYWRWVNGQKAASRVGKVRAGAASISSQCMGCNRRGAVAQMPRLWTQLGPSWWRRYCSCIGSALGCSVMRGRLGPTCRRALHPSP